MQVGQIPKADRSNHQIYSLNLMTASRRLEQRDRPRAKRCDAPPAHHRHAGDRATAGRFSTNLKLRLARCVLSKHNLRRSALHENPPHADPLGNAPRPLLATGAGHPAPLALLLAPFDSVSNRRSCDERGHRTLERAALSPCPSPRISESLDGIGLRLR